MHPPAASKSQNIWVADLHRLAGPLPPSVRLPSEGWSAVVGCDVCNVKRRLKYVNRLGLIFLIIYRPDSLGTKNRLVGGWSITKACIYLGDAVALRHEQFNESRLRGNAGKVQDGRRLGSNPGDCTPVVR